MPVISLTTTQVNLSGACLPLIISWSREWDCGTASSADRRAYFVLTWANPKN